MSSSPTDSSTYCSGTFSQTLCSNCSHHGSSGLLLTFSLLILEAFLWHCLLIHLLTKSLFIAFVLGAILFRMMPLTPSCCSEYFFTTVHDRSSSPSAAAPFSLPPALNVSLLDVIHCFSQVHSLDVFICFQ